MLELFASAPLWLLLVLGVLFGVPLIVGWAYTLRGMVQWMRSLPSKLRTTIRRNLVRILIDREDRRL